MAQRVQIPVSEFKERVQRAAALVREKGLDVLVVNGSEADYANTRYFSITMNRRFHCNFATFLNKLRVEEAMTRMADARFDDVSLQDLAGMVGFASRQSFINAFQKVQGVTPSEYRATVR